MRILSLAFTIPSCPVCSVTGVGTECRFLYSGRLLSAEFSRLIGNTPARGMRR
jgi:hypothetical protein